MTEETNDKRSLTRAAIMLGTYLICVGIVVRYFLVDFPNCDNDRDTQIIWALLTFPLLFLGKFVIIILAIAAILSMGGVGKLGQLICFILYLSISYGPYLLLFWHALKPKNKWLMYLFIAWSIANTTAFLYTKGYFKTSRVEQPKTSTEVRELRR